MEFEKVQEIIAEVLSLDPKEIYPHTTFVGDLGADSLDLFQVVMGIEELFHITIQEDEVKNITTVEEAVALIKNRKGPA